VGVIAVVGVKEEEEEEEEEEEYHERQSASWMSALRVSECVGRE
jgi:hypothetical protein